MRPVICMITAPLEPGGDRDRALVARVGAAARAGVHLIQVRQPHLKGRALLALVEQATSLVRGTGARIVVNDRVDVAIEAGADGVHLRGDSMPAARVRSIARGPLVVGRSVHAPEEATHVAGDGWLDYLIFGSVFAPHSKPAGAVAGVDRLASACGNVSLPVLAVGGMTVDRLRSVAAAGAAGFAAIGMFADAPLDTLDALVTEASRAFDTPEGVP